MFSLSVVKSVKLVIMFEVVVGRKCLINHVS